MNRHPALQPKDRMTNHYATRNALRMRLRACVRYATLRNHKPAQRTRRRVVVIVRGGETL